MLGTLQSAAPVLTFILVFSFVSLMTKRPQAQMPPSDSLRLVIVSDTHRIYRHPIPDGNVLVHCGDSEWSPKEMEHWASKLPHEHVLAISGNMDWRLKDEDDQLKRVTYLQDSSVEISGVKIYGSPWTPKFVGVFQLDNQREARAVWTKVPSDVDVLVSHGPPKGILDITSRGKGVGDEALLAAVRSVKPRVHCFGHIHESYGTTRSGSTLFCNAAVFNGHPPVVVDVPFNRENPAEIVPAEKS